MSWQQLLANTVLVQAIMHSKTLIPRDDTSNNWVVNWVTPPGPDREDIVDAIHTAFYNATTPNVRQFWPNDLVLPDMTYKVFEMSSPPPREPIIFTKTLGTMTSGNNLPEEVAAVLSFRAAQRLNPRHRGRMFIGPLRSTLVAVSNGRAIISSTARQTLVDAYAATIGSIQFLGGGATLAVWSRVDGVVRPIVHAHMDDSFDTQRRRGPRPISRTEVDLSV